jgi:hypothetical protein
LICGSELEETMLSKTRVFTVAAAALAGTGGIAAAENTPDVTATEIRVGQSMP